MKKKELMKLTKEDLVNKLIRSKTNYNIILSKYRRLKADLILVKRQLTKIVDNIYVGSDFDKGNSLVRYNPRKKATINTLQKSRVDNKNKLRRK